MNRCLCLSIYTLIYLGGALTPVIFTFTEVLAACVVQGSNQPGNNPTSGQTIICADNLDTQGVNGPNATGVTVEIQAPAGGISVTGQPGVILGDDATVTVAAPSRPINTQGDSAVGIDVLNGATITINGVVATAGEVSAGIAAGDRVIITIDDGTVRTGGGQSPSITIGSDSTVEVTGTSRIATGNSNSDAVVLAGEQSTLTVGTDAIVTTSSGMSNPVQVDGASSTVNVSGDVRSSSGDATAILGTATAQNLVINIRNGGVVTAQSSNSNAIEITSTGAVITVENGGEVRISSGNSAAIISGRGATVNIDGTVSASSSASQGVVLGDGSTLTVQSRGVIETSSSESQAVLIDDLASTATVNVERGGNIDAVGAQAIVDRGMTDTTVEVDGTVFGGSSEPVLDMGAGNDTITVNGTVRATSANPVIALGAGDDTLSDNSSQTIEGPGTLATGGSGMDTLNLNNGTANDSSRYSGFETVNVGANSNPNDPANGRGSTFNVTNNQSGNQINPQSGGTVNVRDGGTIDLRADSGSGTGSGQQGGVINFEAGSTANVQSANQIGTQPSQEFTNTTFADGTRVSASSEFVRGTASNNTSTGRGEIALQSDFSNGARTENSAGFGSALNSLVASNILSSAQQAALNELIGQASTAADAEALLSQISGEIGAQAAASGLQAATQFNSVLLPANSSETRLSTFSSERPSAFIASSGLKTSDSSDSSALALDSSATANNGVWVSGFGGFVDADTNPASTAFNSDTYGLAIGYDRDVALENIDAAMFGLGVGYSDTDVDGIGDSVDVSAYSIGSYFEAARGPLTGNVAASYSYQDIGNSDAGIDGSGNIFVASSEGFYNLSQDANFVVGPIGRLGATFGSYGGFNVGTDVLEVTYSDTDFSRFTAGLGVRVGGQTQTDIGLLLLNLDLLYEGVLGKETVQFDGQLANSAVSVAAPFANDDGFLVSAGAGLAFSENTSLGLRYAATLGDNVQSHRGEIRLSIQF